MVQKWEKRWKKEMMIMLNIRERGGEEPPGNGGVWWGKCPKNDGGKPLGVEASVAENGGKTVKRKRKKGGEGYTKITKSTERWWGTPQEWGLWSKNGGKW